MKMATSFLLGLGLMTGLSLPAAADDHLAEIAAGDHRPDAWIERNEYRNPVETLQFFGLEPDMTVIELFPGGGWYSSILAPYLKDEGQFVAAHWDMEKDDLPDFYRDAYASYVERFSDTDQYGDIEIIAFDPPNRASLGEDGSADMVLTFRNVHGWKRDGIFGDVLNAASAVLKRGGVLGVVGHRLPEDRNEPEDFTGYIKQSWVVGMAESHGFRLVEASEINANPADTADHPSGVWSLPPSLREGEETADQFRAIGESDRFTLKFVKR